MTNIKPTNLQLANHYADYKLGLTSEPFTKEKCKQWAKLHKLERKFNSSKYDYSDISIEDFTIPVKSLSVKHVELAKAIGWLWSMGNAKIKDGIYSSLRMVDYADETDQLSRVYIHEEYITLDKYVELLEIEHNVNLWSGK